MKTDKSKTRVEVDYKSIKTALFNKDITYAKLSEILHISEGSVINKLSGKSKFYIDELLIISQIVNIDINSLVSMAPVSDDTRPPSL